MGKLIISEQPIEQNSDVPFLAIMATNNDRVIDAPRLTGVSGISSVPRHTKGNVVDRYKDLIRKLYVEEGRPLDEVIRIIQSQEKEILS